MTAQEERRLLWEIKQLWKNDDDFQQRLDEVEKKLKGQKKLEKQVKELMNQVHVMQVILTAMTTGMVEIQGDMHLLECEKRNDEKSSCTCGATPLRSTTARKGKRDGKAKRSR